MKTTHVGSLPFLDIQKALDFTFLFDVPTLFTLPRLEDKQFIAADLLHLLQIGKMDNQRVLLNENYFESQLEISPFYFDQFMARLETSDKTEFKFQLIGPVSFYFMAAKEREIDFKQFYNFLMNKYQNLLKLLSSRGDFLFVLDEPLLAKKFKDSHLALESFVKELQKKHRNIAVHCCDKLSLEQMKKCHYPLNIDFNLYSEKEVNGLFGKKIIPGISAVDKIENKSAEYFKMNHHYQYITPSCGLAFKSIDEIQKIYKNLLELQSLGI